jgi:hypothetical protein
VVAACAVGEAVLPFAAAATPGIFNGWEHFGHLTVLPASSSLAANFCPQLHVTTIDIFGLRFNQDYHAARPLHSVSILDRKQRANRLQK